MRRNARFAVTIVALLGIGDRRVDAQPAFAAPLGVNAKSLDADWSYSRAGGAFTKTPPAGAAPSMKTGIVPLVIRGTFAIDDPERTAGLWVRIAEPGEQPRAAICDGDLTAAAGGYWKDLGYCPTLLNARVTLNGKRVTVAHGPMLQIWLPIEGQLKKGKNTIEVAGDCYTYWNSPAAPAITARLLVAEPQAATIINGPLLGDFGAGYFTVACRTTMPAEVTVEATPIEPPGKPTMATSSRRIWHRMKVQVPAGAKVVRYMVKSKAGPHECTAGPFVVRCPGEEFRFVALGNVMAHNAYTQFWKATAERVQKLKPAFIVHTGNCSEHGSWEFEWERRYFAPAGSLLSSVPTLITPCTRDFAGAVQELHCTPAADMYAHNWSKVVGPLRLIGLDGTQAWDPRGDNYRWLEKELAAAKEKFVFVLNAYPGYTSGKHSKKPSARQVQTRDVILPLLGKHKATALISGLDPNYERCEPTPDKGCTQLIIGSSGKDAYRFGSAAGTNPFGKGKGFDWGGADQVRAVCVFDVKAGVVELQAIDIPADATAVPKVLDKKTFRPR